MLDDNSKINYKVGDIYEFAVNVIHYDFCELIDPCGFYVYLKHTHGLNLSKGQVVKCRVTANYQKRPKIELVEQEDLEPQESRVTKENVSKIINAQARNWKTGAFVDVLLMTEMEDKTFENECRNWIDELRQSNVNLEQVRDDCANFMEQSDFLGLCNPTEREHYQQRLTQIIDELGYYITADKLLSDNKAADYIEHLLDKLEKTGYVYHPEQNFDVLSILFLSDSSLMEDNISRLFDIIRRWPVAIWDKEPFKGALIKTLSLYVDENIRTVGRRNDNGRLVRNLIQALSILYIIANNKDNADAQMPDERLVLSRLCVLSTYIDEFNNKELLSLAVSEMLSGSYYRPRFELADTVGQTIPFDLKRRSSALTTWPVRTSNCFIGNKMRLVVSKDGLAIWSDNPKAKAVIPEQLNLMGNLQVYADRSMMPSLSGDITVSDSKHLWESIERDLFTPSGTSPVIASKPAQQQQIKDVYGIGDKVKITITSVEDDEENDYGENIAYCTIKGETKESGYIYGKDIVSYLHHVAQWMFQDMYGNPLTFEATIIDEDNDGMFHFSMLDDIKDYVCGLYSYGDDIICSMGKARRANTSTYPSPGITKDGFSISLNGSIGEDLERGDLVLATYQGKANGSFHIYCTIKDRFDGYKVDVARAFHNLMLRYSESNEDYRQTPQNEEKTEPTVIDIDDSDRVLDVSYVKEIIRIIDRLAVIDADYVRSYNYIAFIRVLCIMVGWDDRADYYRGRLQLIEMLYDFAINDRVNASQLDMLQDNESELFQGDTKMHEKFMQLRIISFMGNQPHDEELMKFRSTTQGLTRQIASLAIAYNILLENNMTPQANDVLNLVKNMLRLNGYESHLKVYAGGIESRTVEFKTSIVYPPSNDSFPDLKRQTHTILTVIASFLNTDGGTLYIGVNDSGAGVGVYDDLCYQEFNGDKDKYQRYVLDSVALEWDNNVASYVSTDWDHDEKSGKDVLIVTVEPYAKGVSLDGEWVYRNGSGNRHLTKDEFDEYNVRRQIRLTNARAAVASESTDDTQENVEAQPASSVPTEQSKPLPPVHVEKIKTSCRRKNILEEYVDGYLPYEACLKFMPHGKFEKITDYDYDTNTELTLPVYEDDVHDGYLILGYENGTIGKVPVREIMKFDDYRNYNRYTGSRLLFAAIAMDDDGVITVSEEDKTGHRVMVRVDTIANIDKCRLPDSGARVFNEGISSRTLGYEIAPAAGLPDVKNILNKDVRTLGFPLATLSPDIKSRLEQWGVK